MSTAPRLPSVPVSEAVAEMALEAAERLCAPQGPLYNPRLGRTGCYDACKSVVETGARGTGAPCVFRLAAMVATNALMEGWFTSVSGAPAPSALAVEVGWGIVEAYEGARMSRRGAGGVDSHVHVSNGVAKSIPQQPIAADVEEKLYELYRTYGVCYEFHCAQQVAQLQPPLDTKLCHDPGAFVPGGTWTIPWTIP